MQTPHLWWGYNYSTCKNRYYFIEIRGGGGFVYNILSTKIVYKSVLPLHLPSKYSFYTLHREKKVPTSKVNTLSYYVCCRLAV